MKNKIANKKWAENILNNIPNEVREVWSYLYVCILLKDTDNIGESILKDCEKTIKKFPTYFNVK